VLVCAIEGESRESGSEGKVGRKKTQPAKAPYLSTLSQERELRNRPAHQNVNTRHFTSNTIL
jgi:hypothetical protein